MPVDAPAGTVAVICKLLTTVNDALVPLNVTAVAPVNACPLIVTELPITPLVGEKLETVGVTEKFDALVPVPPGVVTETDPVVAPAGTVAVIDVYGDTDAENVADTPLKVIDVAAPKPEPLIVTDVPTGPDEVPKLVILGTILKFDALFAVPPAVVTEIKPDVAAVGIAAVI